MSMSSSRAMLRQVGKVSGRRFQSSSANKATETAKNVAQDYKSKASEGLSKVQSAAGPAISGAVKGVTNTLNKIGGRTGRLISFVQRQIPPTIYYSKVGLEMAKVVFKEQKMSPPDVATFQKYFQAIVKNPGQYLPQAQAIRNAGKQELTAAAIVLGQVLGFFTVGECIGKMKLVGYRGDVEGAHH